ncbi:MAG: sulfide-dependent adenosine diphosphate thiazole synthase, partial [Candidatus Hadarchaeales archaeon]
MRGESGLEESLITRAILNRFHQDFQGILNVDVAVVGAGPSGLTAARYLARNGIRVAVFERNLHVGGGMWGGGILFPRIVVQESAKSMLEEVGVRVSDAGNGLYTADSVEAVCKLASSALDSGAAIMVGMAAEDLVVRDNRVCGVVLNWKAVQAAGMHVDPVAVRSRIVIDATGHEA